MYNFYKERGNDMKQYYAAKLGEVNDVIDFFMAKNSSVKTGSNNKKYLDITLADCTGEVSAKKWDVNDADEKAFALIKEGDIVKVQANVTTWNGMIQLRILRLRKAAEEDGVDMRDFVRTAPEDGAEMYEFILGKAKELADDDLKRLCVKLLTDNKERLLYYPAAQRNHHAIMGGLLYHTKRMLMTGERVCEVYTNLKKDLVVAGVIIHDIEKLNEIEANEYGISSGYSFEGQLLGHIVQGVKVIDRVAEELGVPAEKKILLEHMILSHHYEPEFGSPKKPLFPEAEILHYLDMIDAKMYDMEFALENVEPGGFSDRVRTLDGRKLYKYGE